MQVPLTLLRQSHRFDPCFIFLVPSRSLFHEGGGGKAGHAHQPSSAHRHLFNILFLKDLWFSNAEGI